MRNPKLIASVILMGALSSSVPALAQPPATTARVSQRLTRVVATDLDKTVAFYKAAFGMQEVDAGKGSGGRPYSQLNFGNTLDEAKANPAPKLFVGTAQADETIDNVAHLAFEVPDTQATVDRAVKAGGQLVRGPYEANTPELIRVIAYVKDPSGNLLELLSIRKK